jgi:hypothetical protein
MPYHSLYRLLGFGIEGEVLEVTDLEVKASDYKIRNFFHDNSSSVSGVTKICLSVSPCPSVSFGTVSGLVETLV